jgi:hypothetical protein
VAAAEAAELEVCADAQHLPALLAAGVRFFHCQHVADVDIHWHGQNLTF